MVLADGLYRGSGYEEALRVIRRCHEVGIRYFDTAPLYGWGRSEHRFGQVLGALPRDSFTLSTKVSRTLVPGEPGEVTSRDEDGIPDYACVFDFSESGIRAQLASSLERLRVDYVDILYLHDSDYAGEHTDAQFAEGLEALSKMREEGIVKAIGMGMNQWEVTARMVERFDLDIILLAGRYTLLEQTALPEFLPLCVERGVRLTIGGPYNSGILASDLDGPASFDYLGAPEEMLVKARSLKAVCDRHGVNLQSRRAAVHRRAPGGGHDYSRIHDSRHSRGECAYVRRRNSRCVVGGVKGRKVAARFGAGAGVRGGRGRIADVRSQRSEVNDR